MPFKSDRPPVRVANEPFGDVLLQAIWRHSLENPSQLALINAEDPSQCVTYRDLFVHAHSVAAFLTDHSIGLGDVACVVLPNCWQYAAIAAGIAQTGGAISGVNPLFKERELRHQFTDSKCRIVFCDDALLERVVKAIGKDKGMIVAVRRSNRTLPTCLAGAIRLEDILMREPLLCGSRPGVNVDNDVCFLPYSSGRRGYPKGVMLTHRNWGTMVNIFSSYWNDVMSTIATSWHWNEENLLQAMPFFHDYGFCMLCTGLILGTTGVCMAKFHPDLYCRTIQEYKIRLLFVAPSTITFLAKSPVPAKFDVSSVQLVCSAGTPASKELCEAVAKRLPSSPHVVQAYGMAEVSMSSHLYVPNRLYGPRYGSSGRSVPTFEAKIVEPRTGQELPPGTPGELWLRGPSVMRGYLNDPSATSESVTEGGWFKTGEVFTDLRKSSSCLGDICYVDADGFLYVVQQSRAVLRVKSYQVPVLELEDLLRTHPLIKNCRVVGIRDSRAGELPKAFVIRRGKQLTEQNVKNLVKGHLAEYKQLRGGVEFVDELPDPVCT